MKRGKPKTDAPQKAETKFAVRNGSEQPAKKDKAVKDPYKTKRPPSAFVLFMKGFRKAYNEKHPHNKSVTVVCKAGGDKWRTMSEEDKAPFVAKANRLKTEYGNKLASYNKSQESLRKRRHAGGSCSLDWLYQESREGHNLAAMEILVSFPSLRWHRLAEELDIVISNVVVEEAVVWDHGYIV